MGCEPLIKTTPEKGSFFRTHFNYWVPAIQAICQRHRIYCKDLYQFQDGSNIVFAVGTRYIVKLYCESGGYERERLLLSCLGNALRVEIPQIEGEGHLEQWPYLVISRLHGQRLDMCWKMLSVKEKKAMVEELAHLIATLHQFPIQGLEALDQQPIITSSRIAEIVEDEREGDFFEQILKQIPPFLESARPLFCASIPPVITLQDIQPEHVLCQQKDNRWRISGFVDFADASIGYRECEFSSPIAGLMPRQPHLLRVFLLAYGYSAAQLTENLGRKLLAALLDIGFLEDIFDDVFSTTPIQEQRLEQIQEVLFTFPNI